MLRTPFYNPELSYEDNYQQGPFGDFAGKNQAKITRPGKPMINFLGQQLFQLLGIPAGPLLNAKYCDAAFKAGFDLCVYKTVRSRAYSCHPAPNVVPLEVDGDLTSEKVAAAPIIRKTEYSEPLTITNSFGVPSMPVDVWQADMTKAVQLAGEGQVLIGSFQGTRVSGGSPADLVADYATAARLVVETGAPIIESNLSCPNEGRGDLICFDVDRVGEIVNAIRTAVPHTPLLLKLSYFANQGMLESLVQSVGAKVEGLCAVNTFPARIVNADGSQALPGEGRLISGTCGDGIRWAGLEMTKRLLELRTRLKLKYQVIGVGGMMTPSHYQAYLDAGADAVMTATGAMWNPYLAQEIWEDQQQRRS